MHQGLPQSVRIVSLEIQRYAVKHGQGYLVSRRRNLSRHASGSAGGRRPIWKLVLPKGASPLRAPKGACDDPTIIGLKQIAPLDEPTGRFGTDE